MPYVSRPVVRLGAHRVATTEIAEDIRAAYPGHPRLRLWLRYIANSGVEHRYWARPFDETVAPVGVVERNRQAFDDAFALAVPAARQALADGGLNPGDVDAIVTSHTTSWTVPSLDVKLIGPVGLRPDVARMPLATLACAGGAQALIRASDYVRAHPGARVLVVAAERLSAIYHRSETTSESMIYRALFGDSAAAAVVSDLPGGMRLDDHHELVLPDSGDRYWGDLGAEGLHFRSTRQAAAAVRDSLPYLQAWLGDRRPEWAVVHPGGPGIIDDTLRGVGLDPQTHGVHARAALAEHANLGGPAILDGLRRLHNAPPPVGARGLITAYGPGFTTAGLYGTWT